MGFRFRRSMKIVPGVRLNFSGSGTSVSFGGRGLHYTIGAKGTRTTVGIPGSGLSWTSYQRYRSATQPAARDQPTSPPVDLAQRFATAPGRSFESADIQHLAANSTSELAGRLDSARKQFPTHLLALVIPAAIFVVAIGYGLQELAVGALAFGLVAWPLMLFLDRRSRTTTLQYNLEDEQQQRFTSLIDAFNRMVRCQRVWRVPVEWDQGDWKRNAGANVTIERHPIQLQMGLPSLVKSNLEFPSFPLGKRTIYFAPDAILIVARNSVAALRYEDCQIAASDTRFIESERTPADAEVVGQTWQYVNKKGGPDRRFSNNRQLPICLYGQVDFRSGSGLNERIQCSRSDAAAEFASRVIGLRQVNTDHTTRTLASVSRTTANTAFPAKTNAIETDITVAFANESESARTLARDHGKFWEFLLVQELLTPRLSNLKQQCDSLEGARSLASVQQLGGRGFTDWLGGETKELGSSMATMTRCIDHDLLDALGKPGVPGDAIKILKVIDTLFGAAGRFFAFEQDLRTMQPPKPLRNLQSSFCGITVSIAAVLEHFVDEWRRAVEGLQNGSQSFEIKVVFTAPPQLERASAEMKRISTDPQALLWLMPGK